MQTLFPLKDKYNDNFSVFYKRDWSCGSCFTGETKSNAGVRWNEHI